MFDFKLIVAIFFLFFLFVRLNAQVTHFDRKKDYLKFKDRMEKEGYEPINDSETTSNWLQIVIV